MKIALEYQPLNLGQGLPDDLVPNYVVESLADVMKDPNATLQQVLMPFEKNFNRYILRKC